MNLPNEISLEILKEFSYSDLRSICTNNKKTKKICDDNEDYLFKNLLKKYPNHQIIKPKIIIELIEYNMNISKVLIGDIPITVDDVIHNTLRFKYFIYLCRKYKCHFKHIINFILINNNNNTNLKKIIPQFKYLGDINEDQKEFFISPFRYLLFDIWFFVKNFEDNTLNVTTDLQILNEFLKLKPYVNLPAIEHILTPLELCHNILLKFRDSELKIEVQSRLDDLHKNQKKYNLHEKMTGDFSDYIYELGE